MDVGPAETVSVVVPSFRRPESLGRCLAAIAAQSRPPDQVVVALHAGDRESPAVVEGFLERLPLEWLTSEDRREVPMMQTALSAASGDVVAMTNDDAEPREHWLAGLLAHYEPGVGGVGGRDVIHQEGLPEEGRRARVGTVQWFGRMIHNHHLGIGPARNVDVLKGVNISLRRELWRLDPGLRGKGAQLHWEIGLCLRARSEGWRLVYDPDVVVDHYLAARVAEDPRSELTSAALTDWIHNELYGVVSWSPRWRRAAAIAYAFLVGQRNAPGPLLAPERLLREHDAADVARRARAGLRGRALAVRTARASRRARRAGR